MDFNFIPKKYYGYMAAILAIFLTSGGIYILIMQPGAAIQIGNTIKFLIPASVSSMSMTSTEFLVSIFLTFAGMAGFVLLDRALQRSFDINGSKMQYVIAVSLIVLSIIMFEFMVNAKITG